MSKKHGKGPACCGPRRRFQNSDIPYADRLLMNKYTNTRDQRNDAARIAMKVSCVALNKALGLGYQRLCRYASEAAPIFKELYSDPEVKEYHLDEMLRKMGFGVSPDGSVLSYQDENGNFVTFSEAEKGWGKDVEEAVKNAGL